MRILVLGYLGFLAAAFPAAAFGAAVPPAQETATFAGGCFWCMQPPFEKIKGVSRVLAGYTGGVGSDVNYDNYAEKGYTEAVQVTFDPRVVAYRTLCDVFWRQINPTDPRGQFVDRGPQYRAAIYTRDAAQRRAALASRAALAASGLFHKPIVVPVLPFVAFYPAEGYHQDYYRKSPLAYAEYRAGSGRDDYLDSVWGADRAVPPRPTPSPDPTAAPARPRTRRESRESARSTSARAYRIPGPAERRRLLSPMAYYVTQENGTEPPYRNAYWNNRAQGIYVDVVSGEPLFATTDQYNAGCGWPSFTRPLDPSDVVTRKDDSLGMERVEVRSRHADSHLGHVFDDGPGPSGKRYCIDSAALRFIPVQDLVKDGYGRYLALFRGGRGNGSAGGGSAAKRP